MMRRAISSLGIRLADLWQRMMGVMVDEGIAWQRKRPPMLKAVLVIALAVIWMAIGYSVSGIVGRLLARRDRRLN